MAVAVDAVAIDDIEEPGVADAAPGLDSENQQYVTFVIGADVFGVPMAPVQEIIRPPEMVQVPLSPGSLLGLANLRGSILPIISLRHIFDLPQREMDDATRILIINLGKPIGFVVDQVARVISATKKEIEDVDAIQATVDTDLLLGVIKNAGNQAMVMILDFARLISKEFAAMASGKTGRAANDSQTQLTQEDDEDKVNELQLVSFVVAGQEYAMPIEQTKEIVQIPEQIISVPHASSHVLGVMCLRNRLLPLVSLRRMFGLPMTGLEEQNRIVVVSLGDEQKGYGRTTVGVVVDHVSEVLRVGHDLVEKLPELFARSGDLAEVSAICRLNKGKRLVSILSAEQMFAHKAVVEAIKSAEEMDDGSMFNEDERRSAIEDDDRQMAVFRLNNDEFGVPIEVVKEIVRVPDTLTRVPKAPHFVEGVINLRGSVLPVVDQRRRFGLPDIERNDRQRIIVLAISKGLRTGFIVDSVTEVLKIPKKAIEPAPKLSDWQGKVIKQVANLEKQKRMILLLDVNQMLDNSEVAALSKVG